MLSLFKSNGFQIVFGSGFARAYILLVELILVLVSANLLLPRDRGVYVAGMGLLKTMAVLATFSLGQVAVHRISTAHDRRAQLGTELGNLILGGIVLSLLGYVIFFAVGVANPSFFETYVRPFWLLVVIGLPIYLFEIYLYTLLTSSRLIKTANISIVAGKTVTWGLVVVSGYGLGDMSSTRLVEYVVLGQFLVLAGYVHTVHNSFRETATRARFSRRDLVSAMTSAARLYPTIVGTVVFGGIDLLLIYNYAGAASTSTYQIALQGIAALSVLPFAVAQFGYSIVTEHGPHAGWPRYRRILFMALAGHILLAAVSVPIAAFAESLLLHKSYPDLFGIYMLLAIGSPGVYLSLTMAPLWIAHGLFLVSSVLSFVTAAVVIPMTVLLVQSYGLRGGAIAFLLAQMVSVITNGSMIYYCEKNDKQR